MPTVKKTAKKTAPRTRKVEQRVTAPKRTGRKKTAVSDSSDLDMGASVPRSRIISKKYLYAVAVVLAVIGILFAASRFWVVAWVDNKPITRFELYSLLEKRDEGKTTEELIQEKLLLSEGQKQRQAVSDGEV